MSIFGFLKNAAPFSLYLAGWVFALMAAGGRTRWALLLLTFLIPLRNVIGRVELFPLGNQYIDILMIGIILGTVFGRKPGELKAPAGLSRIAVTSIIYIFISLLYSGYYLYGQLIFNTHDPRVQDWKNFSIMPVLFFLNFYNNPEKKDIWATFTAMCMGIFVVIFYTTHQISWHPALTSREQITGTFEFLGPNEVAAFLNEYTVILISLLYAFKGRNKWLLLALTLASLYCIVFLYSRGAYIGLMLGLFVLFALRDKKMLLPLILILVLWQTVLPQNVIDRIKQTDQNGQLDPSAQGRLDVWKIGMSLFRANPVMGVGFGSFRNMGFELQDTHNIYVKILTEQGLIGMGIFLITVFFFLKEGWGLYQKGDDDLSKAMGLGFFCSVFVMLANNFFGNRWSYLEVSAYLWVFAGLVARMKAISQNPPLKEVSSAKPAAQSQTTTQDNQLKEKKKKIRYYDPPEAN